MTRIPLMRKKKIFKKEEEKQSSKGLIIDILCYGWVT
jgi:hypothetical protein